jgi:hypothetical protein
MRIAIVVITLAATALSAQTPRAAQEIDRVAAFARLYGVVRYFYPGDAGVTVDWNRFVVHGIARVRRATDTARAISELGQSLFISQWPKSYRVAVDASSTV